MLSGIPNFAFAVGYTNASWTLKADLVAEYVCRLLGHMRARGYDAVTPLAPDPSQPTQPFLDLDSGYVRRAADELPRQGSVTPWRLDQNYPRDVRLLRHGPIEDAGVRFSRSPRKRRAASRSGPGRLSRAAVQADAVRTRAATAGGASRPPRASARTRPDASRASRDVSPGPAGRGSRSGSAS